MMNLHGIAREIAIDEQLNKTALLNKVAREWGCGFDGTVTLYEMAPTATYKDMIEYYNKRNSELTEDEEF